MHIVHVMHLLGVYFCTQLSRVASGYQIDQVNICARAQQALELVAE